MAEQPLLGEEAERAVVEHDGVRPMAQRFEHRGEHGREAVEIELCS
jgi:hypothetical protein